ncbi:sensor histidine kinase [Massilia aquatica]|uniref:histidine kinase n=1 Tax=Massilia aquatica TaxID=2609000 RepID=A0ABX0LY67_9BURK|nr:HAMP domain-containing sensor histidine kinase [Massilia aquatica]NHZ39824.1 HAMP domain-containing histidine kinase [Massilia aquatica]
MRLDRFINERMEEILTEWEAFAQTLLPAASQMTDLALRDHARQILQAIALDIETSQNAQQQIAKSQGLAPDTVDGESAASIHGALRQASNFSLLQLSAEFRALRATVLRLWLPQVQRMTSDVADEMVRFNEAIDQALAESVVTYSARADHMRELFLAILGHDLRAPLSSMSMAGDLLSRKQVDPAQAADIGARVKRGARLMSSMVDDLIGYTRTQLGGGMPTVLREVDLGDVCRAALADAHATHPATRFEIEADEDIKGQYDAVRLHQLLTNLMVNAAQYGTRGTAVRIVARAHPDALTVAVTNDGPVIPPSSLESIFSPLIQLPGEGEAEARPRTSLGLGLFVAREIAEAHGGTLKVSSSEECGTTFTAHLPRAPKAQLADA